MDAEGKRKHMRKCLCAADTAKAGDVPEKEASSAFLRQLLHINVEAPNAHRPHAPLDLVSNAAWSALHYACYRGRTRIVRLLLEGKFDGRGASVDLQNDGGFTALMLAAKPATKALLACCSRTTQTLSCRRAVASRRSTSRVRSPTSFASSRTRRAARSGARTRARRRSCTATPSSVST